MQVFTFSWLDYLFFLGMLVVSTLVGVYFGVIKKQNTVHDYLLGGKQMNVWAISMSVVSSALSAFTLLSVPSDIYRYGITFGITVPSLLFIGLVTYYIFLPVFYKLQVTSIYEYFNIRFNYKVRVLASLLFIINMTLFMPIVIYIPALALGQVTGVNIHIITPIVCSVCIFYTTLGGLRAVVWTDVIQFVVMLGSLIAVIASGVWKGGGFTRIIGNSYTGGRLNISFEFDFLKRDTFWALAIGQTVQMTSYFSTSQSTVQKFLSLPTFSAIKISLIWSVIGFAVISSLSIFSGLLMYSTYMNCDPLEAGLIHSQDQILPLYVIQEISFIPGLCGLFLSGILSAGLSTLSAILNCLAANIYEDFVSRLIPNNSSQERISQYLKTIVVLLGIVSTSLVYVVEKLGNIVALTISFSGITSGPILGLFCAGMLLPIVNSKGAFTGGIASLSVMTWIIMNSQWYKVRGLITYPKLPVSIDGCNEIIIGKINRTVTNLVHDIDADSADYDEPLSLYRVSFFWYALIGFSTFLIVALIVSSITKADKPLNKDCISPIVHFLFKEKNEKPSCYDVALEKLTKEV